MCARDSQNDMQVIRHDGIAVHKNPGVFLFQFVQKEPKEGIRGGRAHTQVRPYERGKQFLSLMGADRHEIIARLTVIILFQPDFLAPGKSSVHG